MKQAKQAGWKTAVRTLFILLSSSLVLIMALAWLMSMEIIPESSGQTISFYLIEAFMFLLLWITAKRIPQKKLLLTVLTASAYICFRLLCGMILNHNSGITITKALISLILAVAAGSLAAFERKSRR